MAKRSHPRRGSMAFSPRKRARRPFGHVKSWPKTEASEVRIQGFAGWKAGMTHILARDLNPRSPSAGQETRVPVTVVECPKMRILGVRGYQMTPYGKQAVGEAWADAGQIADAFSDLFKRLPERKEHDAEKHFENLENSDLCEVRMIVATQPSQISSVPTKIPDVMEIGLDGGTSSEQLNFVKEKLGEEFGKAFGDLQLEEHKRRIENEEREELQREFHYLKLEELEYLAKTGSLKESFSKTYFLKKYLKQ